jgi:lipoprotein-anchoring transpeptidase ErfK/SrfK
VHHRPAASSARPHTSARTLRGVLIAGAVALLLIGVTARASATVRVTFVQGEQNVAVERPGGGIEAAVAALVDGPTAAERARQVRTYIRPGTPVRSVTQVGGVATIDLGRRFVAGSTADEVLARLSQVVATGTSVPGVRSVQVLIEGGIPLGLFPGVNATVPLTRAALRTPDVGPPPPSRLPATAPTTGTRQIQERLAALGYLLPGDADGRTGPGTTAAVAAFQKWEGLGRDGVAGPQTRARLATAVRPTARTRGESGRRIEVLLDRQLVLAIQDDRVVRALHVSSGKPSTPTPAGAYRVYAQFDRWWSVPFREWLLWASPFVGGIAFHQFPEVPYYAASHGCVRVPEANARWLYRFLSVGTPVLAIASSR